MCHLFDCVQLSLVPVAYLSVVQLMCLLLFNHGNNNRAVRAPKFLSCKALLFYLGIWSGGGGGGGGGGGRSLAKTL